MYKVELHIIQRDKQVIIDGDLYEFSSGGDPIWLGCIATNHHVARSGGHDWLGDVVIALSEWSEMSLFPRSVVAGESEKEAQG